MEHLTISTLEEFDMIADGLRDFEFWRNGRQNYQTAEIPAELRWIDLQS